MGRLKGCPPVCSSAMCLKCGLEPILASSSAPLWIPSLCRPSPGPGKARTLTRHDPAPREKREPGPRTLEASKSRRGRPVWVTLVVRFPVCVPEATASTCSLRERRGFAVHWDAESRLGIAGENIGGALEMTFLCRWLILRLGLVGCLRRGPSSQKGSDRSRLLEGNDAQGRSDRRVGVAGKVRRIGQQNWK